MILFGFYQFSAVVSDSAGCVIYFRDPRVRPEQGEGSDKVRAGGAAYRSEK